MVPKPISVTSREITSTLPTLGGGYEGRAKYLDQVVQLTSIRLIYSFGDICNIFCALQRWIPYRNCCSALEMALPRSAHSSNSPTRPSIHASCGRSLCGIARPTFWTSTVTLTTVVTSSHWNVKIYSWSSFVLFLGQNSFAAFNISLTNV
jgi:hypothetical protein